ncbi:restriction endonuclease subunit S [Pseudoalteromonas carrageenovora]|uniref:restriction endonuclease subunit S n=1 Tax=Pseudoalteromonas carrageenovora TaxID=227 RepID=UPI00311DA401
MSELPSGWLLTQLGTYIEVKNGYAFKSSDYISQNENSVAVLRISDIQNGAVTTQSASHVPSKLAMENFRVHRGDLLIAMSGATTGKTGVYSDDTEAYQNQRVGNIKLLSEQLGCRGYRDFLVRYLTNDILEKAYGAAQPNISAKAIEELIVPIAPLNEQIRIADKLDSILAKVNKAQSRLDKIPAILKRFRQSVLATATSGELTREWREDDGHQWRTVQLKDVGKGFNYGSSAKSKPEGDVPVLRMGNLQGGKLDWSNLVFTSDEAEIEKYLLETGDILFNRTNSPELVGKTSIYRGEQRAIYAGYLIRVKGSEQLNTEFLNIQLNSPHARDYCWQVKTDGVSQSNINAKKLQAYEFDLPPMSEQLEIVRRVNELFSRADLFERRYLDARKAFSRLTQSILAKAFRGELVAQDPNDESADKLLKHIRKSVTNKTKEKTSPNIKKEKVEKAKGSDSDSEENSSKANLTSEASDTKDTLRAKYQAEIHKAQISLQGATFSVEQFSSLTEFKGGYVELKKLIMNLLKGVPGINEPLFEVESWDAKSGDYALRLVKS